jgi:hypothetical protein
MIMRRFFIISAVLALGIASASCEKFPLGGKVPEGAVDLGLSVYWASSNLGTEYELVEGYRYAWGETETRRSFDKSDYKWYSCDPPVLTKYISDAYSGTADKYGVKIDKKSRLDREDDAARVRLQGKWRMPTGAEVKELMHECKWIWVDEKTSYPEIGVEVQRKGYRVVGPNGNSIFIPATMYSSSSGFYFSLWSSTLSIDKPERAWALYANSSGASYVALPRHEGHPIRPVYGR